MISSTLRGIGAARGVMDGDTKQPSAEHPEYATCRKQVPMLIPSVFRKG